MEPEKIRRISMSPQGGTGEVEPSFSSSVLLGLLTSYAKEEDLAYLSHFASPGLGSGNEGSDIEEECTNKANLLIEKLLSPHDLVGPADFIKSQWEYVIVLPCPTHPSHSHLACTVSEAQQVYRNCFPPPLGRALRLHMNRFAELAAFERACSYLACNSQCPLEASSFLTLMTNAILVKLCGSLGLTVQQVMSSDSKYLFLLIRASDEVVTEEAARTGYQKELELASIDMVAFEPCDQNLRPFAVLRFTDSEVDTLRKATASLDLGLDDSHTMFEPAGVSEDMLCTYKAYLRNLEERLLLVDAANLSAETRAIAQCKAMCLALEQANSQTTRGKLQTFWDRLNFEKPIGPYMKFIPQAKQCHWRRYKVNQKGRRSIFRNMDKLKLIYSRINSLIALYELKERGLLLQHFPLVDQFQLHDCGRGRQSGRTKNTVMFNNCVAGMKARKVSVKLINSWKVRLFNMQLPLSKIRNYFGEKIAFYFEFLRQFQRSLLLPSVLGILTTLADVSLRSEWTTIVHFAYSVYVVLWGKNFLEDWRKRETDLAVQWGQTTFKELEITRPQFRGTVKRSLVTDNLEEKSVSRLSQFRRCFLSYLITVLLLLPVLAAFVGIVHLRRSLAATLTYNSFDLASVVCAFLNAIQIQVFSYVYSKLNKRLTDLENHKTQSSFETSLVVKMHLFQFCNSFGPLLYIAFFKSHWEGCVELDFTSYSEKQLGANCSSELYLFLFALFIVNYLANILELGVPLLKYRWKRRRAQALARVRATPHAAHPLVTQIESQLVEEQYLNGEYDGTLGEYLELVEVFGFISLFAAALPISCLLSFVGLWLEMLSDKHKVLFLVQRPLPRGANRIGIWWNILNWINFVSVFTNIGVVCFTQRAFEQWDTLEEQIFLVYGLLVAALLALLYLVQAISQADLTQVQEIKKRHDYLVEKLLIHRDIGSTVEDSDWLESLNFRVVCPQHLI